MQACEKMCITLQTAETIKDGRLYTGNLATIDEEGFITLVDRRKDNTLHPGPPKERLGEGLRPCFRELYGQE